MGKSSRIYPGMCAKKENLIPFLTDGIRFTNRNILTGQPKNVGKISFESRFTLDGKELEFSRKDQGEDQLAWIGTLNLIKYYLSNSKQVILVDGVAFSPQEVRNLELELEKFGVRVRAAFIGYSKEAKDARPDKLNLKYNPYDEMPRSEKLKGEVGKLSLPNYEYFDLIESVPPERRDQDIVPLEQADFDRNAERVIEYLLKD